MARIQFSQIRVMVIYVLIFILTNAVISFFFSPEFGTEIYGTRHEFARVFGVSLTYEQMFYQVTKMFKYASVIPLGMIFLLTTNPSEFASSLNGIGVNYKAAFAVALTLRYFPDIQRDYHDIYLAQQARGLELSRKAKFIDRFKNSLLIVIPLIFLSPGLKIDPFLLRVPRELSRVVKSYNPRLSRRYHTIHVPHRGRPRWRVRVLKALHWRQGLVGNRKDWRYL